MSSESTCFCLGCGVDELESTGCWWNPTIWLCSACTIKVFPNGIDTQAKVLANEKEKEKKKSKE